jgi:hypothetical protein
MTKTKAYNPATRKRCVNSAWRKGRRVRILVDDFGYGGKAATIDSVGERFVYVKVRTGKKPEDWDAVAYLPKHLRLIAQAPTTAKAAA